MMRAFSWVPSKYMIPSLICYKGCACVCGLWIPEGFRSIAIYELAKQSIVLYLSCMHKHSFLLARANLNIYLRKINNKKKVFDSRNN